MKSARPFAVPEFYVDDLEMMFSKSSRKSRKFISTGKIGGSKLYQNIQRPVGMFAFQCDTPVGEN